MRWYRFYEYLDKDNGVWSGIEEIKRFESKVCIKDRIIRIWRVDMGCEK